MSEKEKKVPNVLEVFLPENVLLIIHSILNSQKPLSNDCEYLQFLEMVFVLSYQISQVKISFQNEVVKGSLTTQQAMINAEFLLNELKKLKKKIINHVEKRISMCAISIKDVTETKPLSPRLVRLSKRLEFNEKETFAFGFVLISQAGSYFPIYESTNVGVVACMSLYCNMSPKELLDFLAPNRKHILHGLIERDSSYRDCLSSNVLKMPKPCVHALVGSSLTTSEFLKIDKTVLSETLQEEPDFKLLKDEEMHANVDGMKEKTEDDIDEELKMLEKEGEDFDLYKFIKDEKNDSKKVEDGKNDKKLNEKEEKVDESFLTPYKTNIEYLDDRFQLIATKIKIRNEQLEKSEEKDYRTKNRSPEAIIRELRAKERMLIAKCEKRLKLTKSFVPRMELLAKKRKLHEFEMMVLIGLVGYVISHEIQLASSSNYSLKHDLTVGYILWVLCNSLEERIKHRVYFYKNSNLVGDGMITINDRLRTDLMDLKVEIDRRMLDFIVGLDTEFSEIVEGSNLYVPKVKLDMVILPPEEKKLIVETVENFEIFKACRKKLGFDEVVTYGNSLVLLFYGPSGTGKTMLANALANHLKKKLLLINFNSLGEKSGDLMRYIFRECKINDSLLFFDECEAFFETRKNIRSTVIPLLTEIEKHDGLIIMATNCAHDLDVAMYRRITLAIEFKPPDPVFRLEIWKKHFPKDIKLAKDIDWLKLSMNYELTGGLIKNAVLSALSFAIVREGENPTIREEDLIKGAKYQLRGMLTVNEFERRIIPKVGLNNIVLNKDLLEKIKEIVNFEKARKVLFSQWGFEKSLSFKSGTSIVFYGQSGTGKRLAAEAIGFELGCAIKEIDLAEILSRYVYNTSKNIEKLFSETKKTGAILLIEITSLTTATLKQSLFQLLSSISNYKGMVIVKTSIKGVITEKFTKNFKFILEFQKPNAKLRLKIWKNLIPKKLPLDDKVNLKLLANRYDFSGGNIENVLFRAASRAALSDKKVVTMSLLDEACKEELTHAKNHSHMYN